MNTQQKTLIAKSDDNWVCDDNWSFTLKRLGHSLLERIFYDAETIAGGYYMYSQTL